MSEKKICIECGKIFIPRTSVQSICSPECSKNRRRKQNKKYNEAKATTKHRICVVCGKEFETNHATKLTCSRECSDINHKEWYKNNKKKGNNVKPRKSIKQNVTPKISELAEDARKAKELGMSYGMYKALNK